MNSDTVDSVERLFLPVPVTQGERFLTSLTDFSLVYRTTLASYSNRCVNTGIVWLWRGTQICAAGKMPQCVSMLCSLVACGQWCVETKSGSQSRKTHSHRGWAECYLQTVESHWHCREANVFRSGLFWWILNTLETVESGDKHVHGRDSQKNCCCKF